MKYHVPVEISLEEVKSSYKPVSQRVPEKEKNYSWHYQNLRYFSSFYNVDPTLNSIGSQIQEVSGIKTTPIDRMKKMLLYYLGKQPNLKFAFATDDLTDQTIQAQFINDRSAKEFVNYFKGIVGGRLANAEWTAKPLSKRATNEMTDMFDKAMLTYELKPFLEQMANEGAAFDPTGGAQFQFPEDVQAWMDTTWKEFGAELCTDLSTGIWFQNGWLMKMLQAFTYVVTTANCCVEHYARQGRMVQEEFSPMQLIRDINSCDDLGFDDQFIGRIGSATPNEIQTMFPEFTPAQMDELEKMCADNKISQPYLNGVSNFSWIKDNQVSYVKMYWRTKHDVGKKPVKNYNGNPRIAKAEGDIEAYMLDDVAQCVCVGNRWVLRCGYIDNLVEKEGEISRPLMPIIRYMPNTFLGTSESEISSIHEIIDEIGMMAYKVRKMIGDAKGRKYILKGNKFSEALSPKTFIKEIESLPVTIVPPTGEDEKSTSMLEVIDLTLDPSIDKLYSLMKDKEERLKKIMSVSDISMGQQQSYIGNNTAQTTINQNSVGTQYLINGFMEFIRLNMSYAVNATKNLATSGKDIKEMSFLIGKRGLVFLNLWKGLRFEQIFVSLNINDQMDSKQKDRLLTILQPQAQNGMLDAIDYMDIEMSGSMTAARNKLEFSRKVREQKQQQAQGGDQQHAAQMIELQKNMDMMQLQYKEENANWRAELDAVLKQSEAMMNFIQSFPQPAMQSPQPNQGQPAQ